MKTTRASLGVLMIYFVIKVCDASTNHESKIVRVKRQSGPGAQFVGSVFQIPVQTLLAVSDAVQKSFPVLQQAQQRLQQSLAVPRPPQRRVGGVGGGRGGGPTADALNKLYKPAPQQNNQSPKQPQRHRFGNDHRRYDRYRR